MRLFITIISSVFSLSVLAQSKDITINTTNPLLDKNKISLISTLKNTDDNYAQVLFDKSFNKIEFHFYSVDSLIIKIKNKVPILLVGLNNVDTSELFISNLPSTKYLPVDTFFSQTTKYNNKGIVDANSIKTKVKTPKSSKYFQYKEQHITVNNKKYSSSLLSIPRISNGWYCTPGEIAHYQYLEGVEKIYVFQLRKE